MKFKDYLEYLGSLKYDEDTEIEFVEFKDNKFKKYIVDEITQEKIYSEKVNTITIELAKEGKECLLK